MRALLIWFNPVRLLPTVEWKHNGTYDIAHVSNSDQFLPQSHSKRGGKSINADSILTGMSREPEIHQTLLFILFVLQRAVPTAQDVPLILAHPHQLVFIIVENVKDPAEPWMCLLMHVQGWPVWNRRSRISLHAPIRSFTDLPKLPVWPFVTFRADERDWVFQHF